MHGKLHLEQLNCFQVDVCSLFGFQAELCRQIASSLRSGTFEFDLGEEIHSH